MKITICGSMQFDAEMARAKAQLEYKSRYKDPITHITDGALTRARLMEGAFYNVAVQL